MGKSICVFTASYHAVLGQMKEFDVFVDNKPGELARVTDALAQSAINIRGLATEKRSVKPVIKVITDDEVSTRRSLQRMGFVFEEFEVIMLDLVDRPGEIAKVAKKAAKAGLNIESIFLIGKKESAVSMAVLTNDLKKAKEALL